MLIVAHPDTSLAFWLIRLLMSDEVQLSHIDPCLREEMLVVIVLR